ncbi:hypothetical protein BC834DRAFT_812729, partial [Gloeopeniophorella convolvens]
VESTCNTYRAIEMANSSHPHLDVTGIGATACAHGCFVPTSVVDFQKGERQANMDYSLCQALNYNMDGIPIAVISYDIMCQYCVNLLKRIDENALLSIPEALKLRYVIGLFHIHGHQDTCLARFSPSYTHATRQVDGEIIETLSMNRTVLMMKTWRMKVSEMEMMALHLCSLKMLTSCSLDSRMDLVPHHGAKSLAVKEAKLRVAQAHDAIHKIRLALGFKSSLIRTRVRTAKSQKTKKSAWSSVHGVDAGVQEHARVYSLARDMFDVLENALPSQESLPELTKADMKVQTLVLGSNERGQRNEQLPWIWT